VVTVVSRVGVVMAVFAGCVFALAARADEPPGFLKAGSVVESGSLVATRSGVGVGSKEETDEERRRYTNQAGNASGTYGAAKSARRLPSARTPTRVGDVEVPPALLSAVRNELGTLGLK